MRWFGYTFTHKFWQMLYESDADSDYPEGSYQAEQGDQYEGFLSYRGSAGRIPIQLALCGQFNFMPAFYYFFVFCPILVILISLIPDPCNWSGLDAIRWLTWQDTCNIPADSRSWYIIRMVSPPIIIFFVLFWHPVFSWFYRRQKYFVDKFC